MRFLSASLVFSVCSEPLSDGVVVVHPDGRIADVLQNDSPHLPDTSQVEHYNGIICPGFVNAHCHLELSHLLGVLPEGTGLAGFIGGVVAHRNVQSNAIENAQIAADLAMWQNGIQAVGDICNTLHSIAVKQRSPIRYHSFVELLGITPHSAAQIMKRGVGMVEQFHSAGLAATIVPHAPYSVSGALFDQIASRGRQYEGPISMHNQETESEDELFISASGKLCDKLKSLDIPMEHFMASGQNAIRQVLPHLSQLETVILVHNSFTTSEDMRWANNANKHIFWCTCPSANWYIEGRMPDVSMWLRNGAAICVGTDSLASNHQLSILDEMKLLSARCPDFSLQQLLQMATYNGACALGMENETGTLEVSKMPGVLWLQNVDFENLKINDATMVTRLV